MTHRLFLQGAALALALAAAGPALAQSGKAAPRSVQGVVTRVVDGDSLWIKAADGKPIEVRLRHVDAPESCQPWGPEARRALADLVKDKVVTLQPVGRDSFGRTVGAVLVDELDVSTHLVENGHAWSVRTRWDQGPLVKQEKVARALSRGLHSQGGAVQPWEWRRSRGPCPAPT